MNKNVRIVLRILLGFILVVGLLYGLLLLPSVQNYLGRTISHKISQNIPQDISIDTFTVRPSGRVHMAGILIKDHHDDTLAYIPSADARARMSSLFSEKLSLGYIVVANPQFHITKYLGEEKDNLSTFLANFEKKEKNRKPLNMNIARTAIKNANFIYIDHNSHDEALDSIAINDFYLDIRRIRIREDEYFFSVEDITACSSIGTALKELTMDVEIGPHGASVENLHIETTGSDVKGKMAIYIPAVEERDSSRGWIKDISIDLKIDQGVIDPDEIAPLFPRYKGLPPIHLSTNTTYTSGVAHIRHINLWSPNIFTIKGYGDIDTRRDSISSTSSKLILSQIDIDAPRTLYYYGLTGHKAIKDSDIKKLNALSHISGSAVINTSPTKADASMTLETFRGRAFASLTLLDPWDKRKARYSGSMSIEEVDLGLLSGVSTLGRLSMYSQLKGQGYTSGAINANLSSHISSIGIKGYPYSNIDINSTLKGNSLSSHIEINDPNIKATAHDTITRYKDGRYNNVLNMYLDRGHLSELGIIKDSLASLRASIESNITGSSIDDAQGFISLKEVSYNAGNKYYFISGIEASATIDNDTLRVLSITADDIFNAYVKGDFLLSQLPSTFTNAIFSRFHSYTQRPTREGQSYDFSLEVTAPNVKIINTPLLFDGATHITGKINTTPPHAEMDVVAQRINYKNILLDTLSMHLDTDEEKTLTFTAEKMINPLYSMQNFTLTSYRENDSLYVDADFKKWNAKNDVYFNLHSYVYEDSLKNVMFGLLPSEVHLERTTWNIGGQDRDIDRIKWNVDNNAINIDSLTLRSGDSHILCQGFYLSPTNMDFNIHIHNIDMARSILVRKKYPLDGVVNGHLHIYRTENDPTIVPSIDLKIKDLGIDEAYIGDINVAVKADIGNRFISTNAILDNQGKRKLDISGGINILEKSLSPEIYITLDSLDIAPVHYLLPSVFNKSSGTLSADLSMIEGNITVPNINGHVTLNDANLGIAFTNVEYAVTHGARVPVKNSFFHFDNIAFQDVKHGTSAWINGEIRHDNFAMWYLDLHLKAGNSFILNTTEKNNERFYGDVFASGTFDLTGPTHTLFYDIKGKTEKGTVFCIDVGNTTDFQLSDMIEFVPPRTTHIDSLLQNIKKKIVRQKIESTNEMNIQVEADPNALLRIYMDKSVGHMLEGRGNGVMYMHLSPKGTFTMDGTFEVVSGSYNFVYENLFKRKFTLTPGGRLAFDKDPTNPMIDFSATYKNTTKPYTFLNSVSESTREEVLMTIYLTGYLNSPIYTFNIEMPKAPENVREELAYKLSDQEQLNQQFISLMVFNSFTNTGGENQNPNMVATGVTGLATGMLSNQFSNIVQKFVSGVDIDVNLNTSSDKFTGSPTNTDFEVAISKKLFNDKVTVNGVVGVPTGSSQSNLVGDVEIEYNISADGRFRGIFVNRRQDDYLNNQQGYIQSLGVSYRQEFNSFRELGRLIKESFRRKSRPVTDTIPALPVPRDTVISPTIGDTLVEKPQASSIKSSPNILFR